MTSQATLILKNDQLYARYIAERDLQEERMASGTDYPGSGLAMLQAQTDVIDVQAQIASYDN